VERRMGEKDGCPDVLLSLSSGRSVYHRDSFEAWKVAT